MIYETFYVTNQIYIDKVWPNQTQESTRRVTYVVGPDSRLFIFYSMKIQDLTIEIGLF